MICPISGEILNCNEKTWNVDHNNPTFKLIVEEWLNEINLTMDTLPLIRVENRYGRYLPTKERESFRDFHDKKTGIKSGSNECLRIVSKSAHINMNMLNIQNIYPTVELKKE